MLKMNLKKIKEDEEPVPQIGQGEHQSTQRKHRLVRDKEHLGVAESWARTGEREIFLSRCREDGSDRV